VKSSLEKEIAKVRSSKEKGLLDSGIGMDKGVGGESADWLGEMGSTEFKFGQMEEFNISVEIAGGNILGDSGRDVKAWWKWVGERL